MNKSARIAVVVLVFFVAASFAAMVGKAQGKKNAAGEEFFIVAAVDTNKAQLLLKRPTEVTVLVKITDHTSLLDERGKGVKLADLRAGDTIWAALGAKTDGEQVALRVRKGPMTIAALHRLYVTFQARE
jgi:hypothetical protein